MKLNTIDFVRLLPRFMQDDSAVRGLAAGIDSIIPRLSEDIKKLSTWDHIDDLPESELDSLAWELNIFWYDFDASADVKRDLIKNSDKVYQHLGTKWAVENVVSSYYGDGRVEEWFEYGGQPGHFRVVSSNPSLSREKFDEFLSIVNKVKRASAKFDGIGIETGGTLVASAGVAVHEVAIEQYTAHVPDDVDDSLYLYAVGVGDAIHVTMSGTVTAEGDAIIIETPLAVSTDGDAICISS